ncbi:hypothetical protein EDD86DRAFT_261519 [Gorgonomyces haynaldii]|nr:hypothetical protein EDD86DRAFT_261519 [Gorgonomyces haynaldii]
MHWIYTKNRTLSNCKATTTSAQFIHGTTPDVSYLGPFGAHGFVIPTPYKKQASGRGKLAHRSQSCRLHGYASNSQSYRLILPSGHIRLARYQDVIFTSTLLADLTLPTPTPTAHVLPASVIVAAGPIPTAATLSNSSDASPNNAHSDTDYTATDDSSSITTSPIAIKQETLPSASIALPRHVSPATSLPAPLTPRLPFVSPPPHSLPLAQHLPLSSPTSAV